MEEDKNAFMGFNYDYQYSKAIIIQAPYEGTSTYGQGQSLGPKAIIEASSQVETYDIELKEDYIDRVGINTSEPLKIEKLKVEDAIDEVYKKTLSVFKDEKFPIILGGEHSITLGPIKAAVEFFKDITILQIDAHADMRNEYMNSRYNHACVMARARELVEVVSVGIRSYSKEEAEVIEKEYSDCIFGSKINKGINKRILEKLSKKIYLTIDIDGFDPSVMRATGTPEPDGLIWGETIELLKEVFLKKEVVGFDVVELAPFEDEYITDFNCAKLIYKLIGYKFLKKKQI
ncbi:MAG: agmatinase [Candidatus Anstonellaceae archaeon]